MWQVTSSKTSLRKTGFQVFKTREEIQMFRSSVVFTIIALLFIPVTATAQSSLLRGTVTDAQNALIPGVVVTVTNVDTAVTRSTVSDDMGAYAFTQVPPGVYKVQAALPGFNTFSAQIRLQI